MSKIYPFLNILFAVGSKNNNLFFSELLMKSKLAAELETFSTETHILQQLKSHTTGLLVISPDFKKGMPGPFLLRIKELYPSLPVILLVCKKNKIIAADKKLADDILNEEELTPALLKKSISYVIDTLKNKLELEEAIERNELLTKATNNIVWDWNVNKRFAYWMGNGLREILGYSKSKMIIDTDFWEKNLHPEDKDRVVNTLDNIFKKARVNNWEDEYRFKHKNGNYVYIYDRGFIIYKNAKPVRMIGTMEDITEKKLNEASKKVMEANYKNLFDKNPLATFIWSTKNFKILEVNETALEEYGYSKNEFLNLEVFDLRPAEEVERFKKIALKAIAEKIRTHDYVMIHKNKKGEQMLMQVSSYKINYKGEHAIIALAKNITEKVSLFKKLENERSLKGKQIAEAVVIAQEKERSEIGKELHDNVNQLLSASRLYIEAAKNERKDVNALLTQASEYVMTAIEEIRILSKVLNTPLINEIGLLETVENMADDLMIVNRIKIVVEKTSFYEACLHENFKLTLFRIIQEQVTNILKHSKATKATITFGRGNMHVCLKIEDNGIGFDTTKKGKGIGLNNIKSRAALYKGEIDIFSHEQQGTLLNLRFPIEYCVDENSTD
ncbi:MAG: PAS domain S-box protein [Ferruginibacter sp.]